MKAEEMMFRSEVRQMLNEAGINRETVKQMVKEAIDDVVKAQVNQVLMERKEADLAGVVKEYLNERMWKIIRDTTESVVKDKMRWLNFSVNVNVENKEEN